MANEINIEEELEKVRREAYQEGFEAGTNSMKQTCLNSLASHFKMDSVKEDK